jgi:hypothetical protein
MKANADPIFDELIQRIRSSDRCGELISRVPAEEQKRYGLEIYRELMDWLGEEKDSLVKAARSIWEFNVRIRGSVQRDVLGGVHSPRLPVGLGLRAGGVLLEGRLSFGVG